MIVLLARKMFRDMKKSLSTYLVCILIVAVGFCGYSVLSITADQLVAARDFFYSQSNFSQGFATVVKAPKSLEKRLLTIPGIRFVQGRLDKTVTVDIETEGKDQPQLRLVSYEKGGMNVPYLTLGGHAQGRELVVGADFLLAHNLSQGDAIRLLLSGKPISFRVAGIGSSPESIYLVKDIVDLLPDPTHYAMAFMDHKTMEQLFDSVGMVNGFVFQFEPGVDFDQIKPEIEEVLKPFGCIRVFDREGELSSSMVQAELDQIIQMTTVIPFLFLTVAAVILYISLYRMVEQQRVQVGTLMALGVKRGAICFHYMCYGGVTGLTGGLMGGLLGNLCAGPLIQYYMVFFKLPMSPQAYSLTDMLFGTGVATLFCGGLAAGCVYRLWKLQPADALRPATPAFRGKVMLERVPGFVAVLTEAGLMGVRNVFRNKRRSLISLFGIGCAFMIMATLASMRSLMDSFLFDYYETTQRQDVTLYFDRPVAQADAKRLVFQGQIIGAEGVLEFPATLTSAHKEVNSSVQGIETDTRLLCLYDKKEKPVTLQTAGITLSYHMAQQLKVSVGDWLELTTLDPDPKTTRVMVTGLVAQYMGSSAYMPIEDAGRASGYGKSYTSMLIQVSEPVLEQVMDGWQKAAYVTSVERRQEKIDKMMSMIGNMGFVMTSLSVISLSIGFAVIYTGSLVTFEEMKREMAVMQMLGLKPDQCLDAIFTGQALLAMGGIVLGIPMTMAVSRSISATMGTDLYSIPDFVSPDSLLLAVLFTFGALWLSRRVSLRKLRKIPPVDLMRERE